jgi:hypothetical protein
MMILATPVIREVAEVLVTAGDTGGGGDGGGEVTGPKTIDLGDYTIDQDAQTKGWLTDGTDNKESDLAVEDLVAAKYLVLELGKAPVGSLQVIWQGDSDNWGWNQTNGVLSNNGIPDAEKGVTLSKDFVLKIELSKTLVKYDDFVNCIKAKLIIAYYSTGIADLGITKAYLEMAE